MTKYTASIPVNHLVQEKAYLKELLDYNDGKEVTVKEIKEFKKYSKDDTDIHNIVHFNIGVLAKMKENYLSNYQDLEDINDPVI